MVHPSAWTLTEDLERRLEAAEMRFIRRIMRILLTEKKSNGEVIKKMARYKRSLLKTIRERQLQFFGHINRAAGLEKQILGGKNLWYQKQRKTMQKIQRQSE